MGTDPWGIDDGFHDIDGRWHELSAESRTALRTGMRHDAEAPPPAPPLWFVDEGDPRPLDSPCRLLLEDGSDLGQVERLPPDLPLGWHRLVPHDGPTTTVAVRPRHGYLPEGLRAWLWSVQLYAARSTASWGIGDLADLRTIGELGRRTGASFVGVNPLFDARTDPSCETSPYFPSSRRWLHPIWLHLEAVPGAAEVLGEDLAALADQGRALDADRRIDRDAVWALKRTALAALWRRNPAYRADPAFVRWRGQQGAALEDHARYRALADRHGADWRTWPPELRSPAAPAVERASHDLAREVDQWAWVQWLLDRQLAAAHHALPLLADLPVGVDPGGADAWRWQDLLADGVHIGAPPDPLGPNGQDWGAAPFVPWKLRAAAYAPVVEMVRGACERSGALRIDHVMGLFRLFWVPPDTGPAAGGYVRFAGTELLDTVLIEATRAETILVGEDLGTVKAGVRELLADRRVLGTRLVWFEDDEPARLPTSCLAAITTHDLPTVAGLWSGVDTAEAREAGIPVADEDIAAIRARLARAAGTDDGPGVAPRDVIAGAVHALASSPACLVALSLDDALGVVERPNLPSTTDDIRSNWSTALPIGIESIEAHPLFERCEATMRSARPITTRTEGPEQHRP